MNYDQWLWGKKDPFCSLSRHMTAVGACVTEYLQAESNRGLITQLSVWMEMSETEMIRTFAYVAALHDIGKAHPSFQKYDNHENETYRIRNFRHEMYSESILYRIWLRRGWTRRGSRFLASIVRLHHQGKGSCDMDGGVSQEWETIWNSLEKRMWDLFQPSPTLTTFQNLDALGVTLSGILILCDWIASSKDFEDATNSEMNDSVLLSHLRDRSRLTLKSYKLISESESAYPRISRFSELWTQIGREGMRPLQRTCEAVGDDRAMLTIIEAPMGEGKTEAALYIAGKLCELYQKKGIYMALPTAATSNQMVGRVKKLLKAHQSGEVRLMHSMAWMVDEQTPVKAQFNTEDAQSVEDWLRPLRRGLLSENAVGTVDQAMAAATRVKYGFLRLIGLEQKVLIIDEIHAYDIFMRTIIARLLEWCRALNIPVIMLSATLQNRQKQYYLNRYDIQNCAFEEAYPLITQVMGNGEVRQTKVDGTHMRYTLQLKLAPIEGSIEKIADLVQRRAENGGCICAMMNTVKQAQAVYRALKERGEKDLMLFHARFTAGRRAQIEQRCLEYFGRNGSRPTRAILICTQVVEQSLDVDFDSMITQLAPMDLLLQRTGRVHRHDIHIRPAGMEKPSLEVLIPDENASENLEKRYGPFGGIYPQEILKNTEDLLKEIQEVSVPDDVRVCVERAYRDIGDERLETIIKRQLENQMKISDAEGELLPSPKKERFLGQTPSIAESFNLNEADEDMFIRGVRTRDGSSSRRFAFLPADFPEEKPSREWLRRVMEYSCGIPLTETIQTNIINKDETKNDIQIMGCTLLRPDERGLYHWRDMTIMCSDEYGIEVMKT